MTSPFDALGLDPGGDVTDDEVRSAWRRVAAATHPDRADGGDPAAFAAAAGAYTVLRTAASRRDVQADLGDTPSGGVASKPVPVPTRLPILVVADVARRASHGRPWRLAARLLAALAAGEFAVAVAGWQPASIAIIGGALTWLLLTSRSDLAPRRSPR